VKRLLIFCTTVAALSAQRIETQTADKQLITRLETALDHLTVIEIGEPIEQVATGSTAFKVEWRGNKVFLQPLEPEVATNLFIWTRSGKRFSYEVAPAGKVDRMHFAIDSIVPVTKDPVAPLIAPQAENWIPPELLTRSTPIRQFGSLRPRDAIEVLIRDVYRADNVLFVRYVITNNSPGEYVPGAPRVVNLVAPRGPQSLYTLRNTQLLGRAAEKIEAAWERNVPLLHAESSSSVLRSGEQTSGILAIRPEQQDQPRVVRLRFATNNGATVSALVVL
jgi:hypothetical protein